MTEESFSEMYSRPPTTEEVQAELEALVVKSSGGSDDESAS